MTTTLDLALLTVLKIGSTFLQWQSQSRFTGTLGLYDRAVTH